VNDPEIDLSIIIVAWNGRELVDECLEAIQKSSDTLTKEILLVDNASVDGTADHVARNYPEVILIRSETNLGFTRANNLAYKRARGKYILMLNSDAFVFTNTLQETVDFMRRTRDVGVLGARLVGRDGALQPSARYFPTPIRVFAQKTGLIRKLPFIGILDDLTWDHKSVRECDWVVGCYLLARKDLIDILGFFLREEYFMYNDDNDLCLRIKRLGYKVIFYPTDVIHLGGATAKKMIKSTINGQVEKFQIESQAIYYRKNYGLGIAALNLLLMLLYDFLIGAKILLRLKRKGSLKDQANHMSQVLDIYLRTRFGTRPIN
jgi:N-acetylglucosaminyl-diphospho-decaprenol L-rhamnosyltransferase